MQRSERASAYRSISAMRAWLHAAQVVADATGMELRAILAANRPGRHARRDGLVFARRAATYLAVTGLDMRMGAIARATGRPRIRVLMDCRRAEDSRDVPGIDALFERMERML